VYASERDAAGCAHVMQNASQPVLYTHVDEGCFFVQAHNFICTLVLAVPYLFQLEIEKWSVETKRCLFIHRSDEYGLDTFSILL
jgi:ribonucleotide reductase beta subunit family protein with ferritin-like domain